MSQKQEINSFSEESQKLLEDMIETEIFELYENSAKLQCPDWNSFTEIGIIYCSCGRNLKYKRSPTTTQKANCDFSSIPDFVIKKNSSRGQKHDASERQIMLCETKEILKKAWQSKHGGHPTILARKYAQARSRRSLTEHNIGEKEIMLYDRIAIERHDYTDTRAERLQNVKHWFFRSTADGSQKLLRQRQEFSGALKQCLKMQDTHLAGTQQSLISIRPQHQQRQRQNQQFEGGENFDYYCRSQDWMTELQRVTGKHVDSIFIFFFFFIFAVVDFGMTSELELMTAHITWEMLMISVSWKEFQKIDGRCRQDIPFIIGTPRSTPRSPITRQVASSRITLTWKSAEWRKSAHDNSHSVQRSMSM